MKNKQVMTVFAGAMLLYTAWRTYDYMGSNLSDVSDITRLLISVAFLCFSEVGLLVWLHGAQPNATSETQETVSSVMIWIDFAGSMLVGLADLIKHNTLYQVDLSVIDPILFLAPWIMVVLNVAGYLVFVMNDSGEKVKREDRRMKQEEHELEIAARRAAIQQLRESKEAIATDLAPHYYEDIRNRITGRTLDRFKKALPDNSAITHNLPPANLNGRGHDITVFGGKTGAGEEYNDENPTQR